MKILIILFKNIFINYSKIFKFHIEVIFSILKLCILNIHIIIICMFDIYLRNGNIRSNPKQYN